MDDLSVLAVLYILPLIDANCLQDPIRVEKTNLIVSIKIFMFLFPFMCWFFNYGSLLVYLPWYIIPRKKICLSIFSLYLFIMHMFNMEITLLMLLAPWYFNCSLNFSTTKWKCIFYLINNDHESSGSLWFCVYKLFLHLDLFFVTTFVSPWF